MGMGVGEYSEIGSHSGVRVLQWECRDHFHGMSSLNMECFVGREMERGKKRYKGVLGY